MPRLTMKFKDILTYDNDSPEFTANNEFSSLLMNEVEIQTYKKAEAKLRELIPAARGSHDGGSRNLAFTFFIYLYLKICNKIKQLKNFVV